MMDLSITREALSRYIQKLLASHLPDGKELSWWSDEMFSLALERCEYSFSHIRRKYYRDENQFLFDHLNGDHMAAFLYFLGNTLWKERGDQEIPTRLFYLNKVMHGLDLFYSVGMPDIFLLVHPLGTVVGNASFGDFLVVYQNCTVGAVDNAYPVFGKGTILYSRSSVLGGCNVGDNVVFAANSALVETDVRSNTVVLGVYPNHRFVSNQVSVRERCFDELKAIEVQT